MNREIARAGLLIGSLLLVGGVPLLLVLRPGTGEYVITLFTVLIGMVFIVALGIAIRISQR
ncbi:MAG: hypothetical protein BroJett021_36360 [Chloroflexota bacterium]|jgi:hypothetical protein|nr:hypothetical protein [Caldilinea sp.]GIK74648.1 MAG: hypothetical protein BroJett021_36360 [Chloroflexota bacterium]